jgi:protein-disulfide isomerase/uncharacterized membrane protein
MSMRLVLLTLTALLSLTGLIDSLFLTWDHQLHLLDPGTQEGICVAGSGCEISRNPRYSELPLPGLPGLPLSLLGVIFYVAALFLCRRRLRDPEEEAAQGLHLMLAGLGVFMSVVLGTLSLNVQGTLCPFCAVLYGVNLLLLILGWLSYEHPKLRILGYWPAYLTSQSGRWTLGIFLLGTTLGYGVYVPPLLEQAERNQAALLEEAKSLGSRAPLVVADFTALRERSKGEGAVLIVEIADMGCPHCHGLYDTLHELQESDELSFALALVHYPLDETCNPHIEGPRRSKSCRLARAAICGEVSGLGWDYLHFIFEHGRTASLDTLIGKATHMGLDGKDFERCMASEETDRRLESDIAFAASIGVRGTPVFLVDGRKVEGGRSAEMVQAMLESVRQTDGAR